MNFDLEAHARNTVLALDKLRRHLKEVEENMPRNASHYIKSSIDVSVVMAEHAQITAEGLEQIIINKYGDNSK